MGRRATWRWLASAFCLVAPFGSAHGKDYQGWEFLPQVDRLVFDPDAVGLKTRDSRFFLLDRTSKKLSQVRGRVFSKRFIDSKTPAARLSGLHRGEYLPYRVLLSSDGGRWVIERAYCSEGRRHFHRLWRAGHRVPDRVDPCNTVWALEVVGDELWLGTLRPGELGDYPAEGVVIQDLERGSLKARIASSQGLTGNLINAIRVDPYSDDVWVATQLGIDRISRDHRVLASYYFFEDFDRASGRPVVRLSSRPRKSNALALASRELGIRDKPGFYRAVRRIPARLRGAYCTEMVSVCSTANPCPAARDPLLPPEFNVLVPFLLDALEERAKVDPHRFATACWILWFYDERVVRYLQEKVPVHNMWIRGYLGRFYDER